MTKIQPIFVDMKSFMFYFLKCFQDFRGACCQSWFEDIACADKSAFRLRIRARHNAIITVIRTKFCIKCLLEGRKMLFNILKTSSVRNINFFTNVLGFIVSMFLNTGIRAQSPEDMVKPRHWSVDVAFAFSTTIHPLVSKHVKWKFHHFNRGALEIDSETDNVQLHDGERFHHRSFDVSGIWHERRGFEPGCLVHCFPTKYTDLFWNMIIKDCLVEAKVRPYFCLAWGPFQKNFMTLWLTTTPLLWWWQ